MKFYFMHGFIFLLMISIGWTQTTINVTLPTESVEYGSTIEIPVSVGDLTGKNVYDVKGEIQFDENILDFLGVINDGCLCAQTNWSAIANTDQDGMAIFGCYGPEPLSGSGSLVKLQFQVTGDYGESTTLTFKSFDFTNSSDLTPQFTNGSVEILLQPIRVIVTTDKGKNAQVIVDDVTQTVPYITSWYPGSTHTISIAETQDGGEGARYHFQSWSDGGARTHTVNPTSNVTFMANLQGEYYLTINSQYGNPSGQGWYDENSLVTIFVDSLYQINSQKRVEFASWSGAGVTGYTGTENPYQFNINSPVTETIIWNSQYHLEVKSFPENFTDISGTGWYDANQSATTGTAPSLVSERSFKGWKLDDELVAGNPINVIMDTSHVAVADYSLDISIVVTTSSGNGTVLIDGVSYNAPAEVIWSSGASHTIGIPETQQEQSGARFRFSTWSDGGERIHSVAPEQNMTYTAELVPQVQLVVSTQPEYLSTIKGSGWYDLNTLLTIGPAPATQTYESTIFTFNSWTVDQQPVQATSFQVKMEKPINAVANYYQNYFISGLVTSGGLPLANIRIRLSGGTKDSVLTNDNGEYVFQGLLPNSYAVMPVTNQYTFTPARYNYSILFTNQKLQNFTAEDTVLPSIQILSPKDGDKIEKETNYKIQWSATDNVGIDSVLIYFSINAGVDWIPIFQEKSAAQSFDWEVFNTTSKQCQLKIIVVDFSGNRAEDVSGIFEIVTSTNVIEGKVDFPKDCLLNQNFPNPFNPVTEITYQIPTSDYVTLQVFNITGQHVKTLVSREQGSGTYTVRWFGLNEQGQVVPSGIYYYQLCFKHIVQTRKMILMH